MVITITTDDLTNGDNEERIRMRKRFRELDELQRKREEAGAAWVFVGFFGFLITFIGALWMMLIMGIIPLNLEMMLASGVILFGAFLMAIAVFLKNSPTIVLAEL